jgi:hypothetical protein
MMLFNKKIFLAQFLLTVEGRASWLHWPKYALLGLRKALKIKTFKSSSNHHAPSCPTTAPVCACLLGWAQGVRVVAAAAVTAANERGILQ